MQDANDCSAAVATLRASYANGAKYHLLRDLLRKSLPSARPTPAQFTVSALRCLAAPAPPTASGAPAPSAKGPLFHLLLECLACVEAWARPHAEGDPPPPPRGDALASAAALQLFLDALLPPALAGEQPLCGVAVEPRCVLRLAQAFQISRGEVEAAGALERSAQYCEARRPPRGGESGSGTGEN